MHLEVELKRTEGAKQCPPKPRICLIMTTIMGRNIMIKTGKFIE
jgi:hypothetical protein